MTFQGRVGVAALVAMAVAVVMGLSGCSLLPGQEPERTPVPRSVRTPPSGAEGLAKYYSQELEWKRCAQAECAGLEVPLDYAKPEGESITVQVLRVRASRERDRLGSVVVNPGGPGASGVDYARSADFIVGKPVRQRYDVVGFDPRGVQRSAPVDCLSDERMDDFLGQDPTPDDAAEVTAFMASMKTLGEACEATSGPLIAHISTRDAARDMDILRAALGDAKLNYLGKSYGTYLGAVYAEQFPQLVGRFVLDGVLPPDLTLEEAAVGQSEGFERAAHAYARDCVSEGGCPLGDSEAEVMDGMAALLERLDANPVPMQDGRVAELTEGWASLGIAQAMYDQGSWAFLTDALRAVVSDNDGTELMAIADQYARRNPSGRYTANLLEAFYAISCADNQGESDPAFYERIVAKASEKAPVFGPALGWGMATCSEWPVAAEGGPRKIAAQGSGPIVVVGTTRDPATPYEWSARLRDQLANASLVSFDGDGHTAYARSNRCVDNAINDYYVKGTVPHDGLTC